jgi:hypothetical protein
LHHKQTIKAMPCLQELFPLCRRQLQCNAHVSDKDATLTRIGTRGRTRRETNKNCPTKFQTDSTTFREEEEPFNFDSTVRTVRKTETTITCSNYAYMSNHRVINHERAQRGIPLLTRCAILDEIARGKAQEMANRSKTLKPYQSATMVENVQKNFFSAANAPTCHARG